MTTRNCIYWISSHLAVHEFPCKCDLRLSACPRITFRMFRIRTVRCGRQITFHVFARQFADGNRLRDGATGSMRMNVR